jgi:hypothetical protein
VGFEYKYIQLFDVNVTDPVTTIRHPLLTVVIFVTPPLK